MEPTMTLDWVLREISRFKVFRRIH